MSMATLEELETRLARLESLEDQRRDLQVQAGLQAQAYGLSLVHTDTQAILGKLEEHDGKLTEISQTMAEILNRLPASPPEE